MHNTYAIKLAMNYMINLVDTSSHPDFIKVNFSSYVYDFLFNKYGNMHTDQWYQYIVNKVKKYYFETYI